MLEKIVFGIAGSDVADIGPGGRKGADRPVERLY